MSRFSDSLLEQAQHLASRERGKPRQASLRRAVSDAYYSVFHLLCDDSAGTFVGRGAKDTSIRQLMTRAFVHTQMKEACLDVQRRNPSSLYQPYFLLFNPLGSPELQRLSSNFVRLQTERHRADYDLSNPLTRSETFDILDLAEQARDDWNTLKIENPELARFFSLLLLLRGSLGARK